MRAIVARLQHYRGLAELKVGVSALELDYIPISMYRSYFGVVVADPLRPSNQVLTFTGLNGDGDIFSSTQFNLSLEKTYTIEFEYMGLAKPGSVQGDFGGFAGLSEGFPGRATWYYSTASSGSRQGILVDDGTWRSYQFTFQVPFDFDYGGGSGTSLYLMFEDYVGSGGVPGDAFFDNVRFREITAVPEPSSILFSAIGLACFGWLRQARSPSSNTEDSRLS